MADKNDRNSQNDTLISIERMLGRVEAGLESLKDNMNDYRQENLDAHKEMMSAQTELCKHVNHENELMSARITDVEMNGSKFMREAVSALTSDFNKFIEAIKTDVTVDKKRILTLEDEKKQREAEREGQKKIYKITTGILALIITGLTIARGIGLI